METITIIGTGLMGSVLGHALRNQGYFVVGYDRSPTNLNRALSYSALDAISHSIEQAVERSTFVILATPVDHIYENISHILSCLPSNAVLVDTGSTKSSICQN